MAVGAFAAPSGQAARSICLNASGASFSAAGEGLFVKPVAVRTSLSGTSLPLYLDSATNEVFAYNALP